MRGDKGYKNYESGSKKRWEIIEMEREKRGEEWRNEESDNKRSGEGDIQITAEDV